MVKRALLILFVSLLVLGINGVARAVVVQDYFQRPVEDAFVDEGNPFGNFGSAPELWTRGYFPAITPPGDFGLPRRSYLKFDLTEITENAGPDAEILSATFGIYVVDHNPIGFNTGDPFVSLHYVSGDGWSESTLTWMNKPGFTAEEFDVAKNTVGDPGTLYTWDLLVDHEWDSSADLADGLISLMAMALNEGTNNYAKFYSSEYGTVELRPFLHITYIPEPTTICLFGLGAVLLLRKKRR